MDKNLILDAIRKAQNAPMEIKAVCGCGRAYVCLIESDRKVLNMFKKAVEESGYRYLPYAYGAGPRAMYIGYDNGTGREIERAKLIAQELKHLGLFVTWEGVAD